MGAKSVAMIAAAIAIGAGVAADANGGPAAACGSIDERLLYEIKTARVSCATGRRVAQQWAAQCAQIPTGSCLVSALFYCRYRNTGYESGAIRCIYEADLRRAPRAQRTVTFVTGS